MIIEPFIAHSKVTNEIYIVCGAEKYLVTEQVIKAMQNTGRLEQQPSDDCVSRKKVNNLPPVIPSHGTCKDCKHCCYITGTKNKLCEKHSCMQVSNNWYCADFEKRGSENG